MSDAFALLEFPRQPWLEPDALKQAFLDRSTAMHPDKFMDPAEKDSAQARICRIESGARHLTRFQAPLAAFTDLERGQKPEEVHDILARDRRSLYRSRPASETHRHLPRQTGKLRHPRY